MNKRRKVMNREEEKDRLSDLPDCVLTHLMTFIPTIDSVRTSVLSKRWEHMWKQVPSLTLHTLDTESPYQPYFKSLAKFDRFLSKFLSLRDNSVPLSILDFTRRPIKFPVRFPSSGPLIKIMRYAASHNVEQMKITINADFNFRHSLLLCQNLRWLELEGCGSKSFPRSLDLAALETLSVGSFVFYGDGNGLIEPFSCFARLKTLVIGNCQMLNSKIICISNGALTYLSIFAGINRSNKEAETKIVLDTPNLVSFTYSGFANAQELSATDNLSCLKELDIDIRVMMTSHQIRLETACVLIKWLPLFGNVESMTISSCTLQVLSLIPDVLKKESCCLEKLKSLIVNDRKYLAKSPPISIAVVDYLIRNSSSAKITTRAWYGW